jgi:hypothetical protein
MIANADGSGSTLLFEGDGLGPVPLYNFNIIASPIGGTIAVYTFDDPETMTGPSLSLIDIPLGDVVWTTRLLSNAIETELAEGADYSSPPGQAAAAITAPGSLAWSPDGRRLAFNAALDGPSADVYVYDLSTRRLARVTAGSNQTAGLLWSPDSQWIAHQAVQSFGTGAGWDMGAVWAVTPNGRTLRKLYTPASGGEVFIGWSEGGSLLAYSFTTDGLRDVRAVGLDSGIENVLIPSYFTDAVYDPDSGTVAYAVPAGLGFTGSEPGAFLWHPVWSFPKRVDPGDWSEVQWAEGAGRYYFEGDQGVLGVRPGGGGVVTLPIVDHVSPSPDGRHVALWGDGFSSRKSGISLYTADLEWEADLAAGDFDVVIWRLDSAGLMTVAADGLVYQPLDGRAVLIDPTAVAEIDGGIGWVRP